jgi:hypothetical protein
MLAQAERDAAEVRAGRKQLRPDGTLLAIAAPETTEPPSLRIEGDRVEPTLGLTLAVAAATTTAATDAARAEINSAKAILFAEEQLAGDHQEPPDRSVDEDWLFTWREYAGRVSGEDLQRLWGSVLAGEVKSPGRHSMRTLEFLKLLSKPEAELIATLARYAIDGRIVRSQSVYLAAHGLSFGLLLRLQELGVLSGVEAIGLTTEYKTISPGKFVKPLISHNKVLVVEHEDESKVLKVEVYTLTVVGAQILGLGSFEPDLEYLRAVAKGIAGQGFRVQLCDWQQLSETHGRYSNEERIDA